MSCGSSSSENTPQPLAEGRAPVVALDPTGAQPSIGSERSASRSWQGASCGT